MRILFLRIAAFFCFFAGLLQLLQGKIPEEHLLIFGFLLNINADILDKG